MAKKDKHLSSYKSSTFIDQETFNLIQRFSSNYYLLQKDMLTLNFNALLSNLLWNFIRKVDFEDESNFERIYLYDLKSVNYKINIFFEPELNALFKKYSACFSKTHKKKIKTHDIIKTIIKTIHIRIMKRQEAIFNWLERNCKSQIIVDDTLATRISNYVDQFFTEDDPQEEERHWVNYFLYMNFHEDRLKIINEVLNEDYIDIFNQMVKEGRGRDYFLFVQDVAFKCAVEDVFDNNIFYDEDDFKLNILRAKEDIKEVIESCKR